MNEFYSTNIIIEILKTFNVNHVVVSGITDESLLSNLFNYEGLFTQINDNGSVGDDFLNMFHNFRDYDAIFIDDDSNWYTVYNELKIIEKSNKEFPLVFICNANFPNKRRDSYLNPSGIPSEFRQKYTKEFPICYNKKKITINDGFYHALQENTPKNGVLTAIEDFLKENDGITMMKINSNKEIIVLYQDSPIYQRKFSLITENISNENIIDINLQDKLIENQLLISYIEEYMSYKDNLNDSNFEKSKKERKILDYENKIKTQNNELSFKETQLSRFESEISLKDSQIKNFESKLVNKDNKIDYLEKQLKSTNKGFNSLSNKLGTKNDELNELTDKFNQKEVEYTNEIILLKDEINQKNQKEIEYSNQISIKDQQIETLENELTLKENDIVRKEVEFNNQINIYTEDIREKDNQIKIKQQELNENNEKVNSLEQCYTKQLAKIENNEYCINCFKEEISNNRLEINYLQNNGLTKKILSPLSYLYLIFKSKPKEILLNIKLYRIMKDSKCFDIGFYLNNNKDLVESNWCRYFSPELHYICKGFDEKRTFNKKYFNRNSKEDLFEYILSCDRGS